MLFDQKDPDTEYPLNLRSATLNGGRLHNTNLAFSTLRDASLQGVTIWASDLSGAILRGADLSSPYVVEGRNRPRIMDQYSDGTYDVTMIIFSRLRRANMIETRLIGSWLRDSDFSEALLWNADLSGSTVLKTDFSKTFLMGSNLAGAHFERVNFTGANLQGANVSGADFGGFGAPAFGLTQTQLNETVADHNDPPLLEGVEDPDTGEPFIWHGTGD